MFGDQGERKGKRAADNSPVARLAGNPLPDEELPDKIDNSIPGRCKSWCDRHEACQLVEKGDWDGAYEKILQARVGTIEYGHRDLNKGLTMERILRMSAEIQTKRGNDREAKEDLQYAQSIADHAARLRVALEAQLKTLDDPKQPAGSPPSQKVSRTGVVFGKIDGPACQSK